MPRLPIPGDDSSSDDDVQTPISVDDKTVISSDGDVQSPTPDDETGDLETPTSSDSDEETPKHPFLQLFQGISGGPQYQKLCRLLRSKTPSLQKFFDGLSSERQSMIFKSLEKLKFESAPTLIRILESSLPEDLKVMLVEKHDASDSKFVDWIEGILKLPIGKYVPSLDVTNPTKFLAEAETTLNASVWGQQKAKHKLVQYLGHLIRNPEAKGLIIGLEGEAGVGKTSLINRGFAKALGRPFVNVPLSSYDLEVLVGHSFTWHGSIPGQIATQLTQAGVMNPVFYFDEIDKLSESHKGTEVMNLFVQLTDPIQSAVFQDRYFAGINLDLSRAVFVFSYNDASKLPPVLKSRIFRVKVDNFSTSDKVQIVQSHLLDEVSRDLGFSCVGYLAPKVIEEIIQTYTCEGGVRKLKEALVEIFRELNLRLLRRERVSKPISVSQLKKLYIKTLRPILRTKTHELDQVGKINGLYYCEGHGGILPIEGKMIPAEKFSDMIFTGNVGKVMAESSKVALAVAWNLIPSTLQETWRHRHQSFHIHCEDLSTPKEGPSATLALTILFYSLLTNQKIFAHMGITGEMNFSGRAMQIGGLKEKMTGAREAGVTHVLYPTENQVHIDMMIEAKDDIVNDRKFKFTPVASVSEAIKLMIAPRKRARSPSPVLE